MLQSICLFKKICIKKFNTSKKALYCAKKRYFIVYCSNLSPTKNYNIKRNAPIENNKLFKHIFFCKSYNINKYCKKYKNHKNLMQTNFKLFIFIHICNLVYTNAVNIRVFEYFMNTRIFGYFGYYPNMPCTPNIIGIHVLSCFEYHLSA